MLHKLVKHRSDKQQYNAIVFTYNVTKFSLRNTFLTSNVLVLGIVSLLRSEHRDDPANLASVSSCIGSSYLYGNDLIIGPKLFKASFIGTAVE